MMREERWEKLKSFVAEWHRPLAPGDGYSEEEIAEAETRLGIRFPEALREWYRFAGRGKDFTKQNWMNPINQLDVWHGMLDVWHENCSVCIWGIKISDLEHLNYPVYGEDSDGVTHREVARNIEDFLFAFLVHQYQYSAPFRYWERTSHGIISILRENGSKIQLPMTIPKMAHFIGDIDDVSILLNSEIEVYSLLGNICTWGDPFENREPFVNREYALRIGSKDEPSLRALLSFLHIEETAM